MCAGAQRVPCVCEGVQRVPCVCAGVQRVPCVRAGYRARVRAGARGASGCVFVSLALAGRQEERGPIAGPGFIKAGC